MIREERNPDFWMDVLSDPAVVAAMRYSPDRDSLAQSLARDDILPLAAQHGGFWFNTLDPFGRVSELHTMFTPAGWGREVHAAAKEAFTRVFSETSCVLIVTHEVGANPRSRPPLSFGFRCVGPMMGTDTFIGDARTWLLTVDAWFASPAGRRQCQ
jgi:hypothetical protein